MSHTSAGRSPISEAPLDLHDRLRLALEAEVNPRTLDRALAGKLVRPISRRRIRRILEQRGLLHMLPAATGSDHQGSGVLAPLVPTPAELIQETTNG